jgi:polyhydroxyalkanoate synthesis regulator phasin
MNYNDLIKPLDKQIEGSGEPLPKNMHCIWLLVGSRGRGKSTLLLNSLYKDEFYKGYYDNIFLISPTALNDSKFKPLIDELSKEAKYYSSASESNVQEIMESLKVYNKEFNEKRNKRKARSLIIFDDCLHELPKSTQKSCIHKLITTNRHLKCSIFITTQMFKKLNPVIRTNLDMISFFQSANEHEKKNFCEEYGVDMQELDEICENNNDFIHLTWCSGKKKTFNKFQEI